MPHLLNVNNYHYRRGGAEAVYLGHGAMFADAGWSIDWFSMKHPLNPHGTDERFFAELIDLEYMQGGMQRLKAAANIIYNPDARARIGALIDERRPDVAHLHNIYHHLSPSILLELKRRGVPVVLTAHDLKMLCPSYKMISRSEVCERCKGGRLWNLAARKCLKNSHALSSLIALESSIHRLLGLYARFVDRIVVPSLFYRTKFLEWGWDSEQVVYIPNFLPLAVSPRRVPEFGPVLYFGRLSEEKGVSTLIHAAARSGVAVVIAGTGPEEEIFRSLATELSAPVTFVGHRLGAELVALVQSARAVVLPSEWYENAPMSVLEAYAAGRPVLGAAIGGIPELIREGVTGWTFSSGDVDALAAALSRIAEADVHELNAMGRAGAALAAADFSQHRYLERMQNLYCQL
jgi:glycosyltransferase involved in cell wall biosynthesis